MGDSAQYLFGLSRAFNRRRFLQSSAASAGLLLLAHSDPASAFTSQQPSPPSPDPWSELPRILARIRPPVFPKRDFDVTKFGGTGDGQADCTEAFGKAIAACHQAGGGRVVVPAGNYSSGAIRLLSGVNLHLEAGATIRFSTDTRKYPLVLTRWEGTELMNFSPLIYAFEQENIAITGEGTLDGGADCEHWWSWKRNLACAGAPGGGPSQDADRKQLEAMAEAGTPVEKRVFGQGHYLRPQLVEPYRCKNVLIEGVTLLHSPMWQIHPVLCSNVTVRGLTMQSAGPNTDGCDPESSSDVLIEDCTFDTGDDCIAIKSGRNADGRRLHVPSRNIVIRRCRMKGGHGGVTLGSEITGGVNHVDAENCHMDSPHLEFAVRIKNNAMRGGLIEKIYVRNIEVGQVAHAALAIDFYYEEAEAGGFTPIVRDVEVSHLNTEKAAYAVYLRGFKQAPIENVSLMDCNFDGVARPDVIENVQHLSMHNVKENGKPVEGAG
jgi:polygalacturonase